MFSRRRFLRLSALTAGAAFTGSPAWACSKPFKNIGVQLWSVREAMGKDARGTVEALARMGYKNVEGFGFGQGKLFGMPYKDFGALLRANGLRMPSSHVMFALNSYDTAAKALTDEARRAIDAAAELGQEYVVCPWMNDDERGNIAGLLPVYRAAAAYVKQAGMRFGYHNHDFEFVRKGPDGRLLQEWLLEELDPADTTFELDLYWVAYAGQQATEWFERYPGRFELCHVKDMAKTPKRQTVEVGDGSIDFGAIFKQSAKAGLKHYIVELEDYVTTPLQGVERSLNNLKKIKV